MINIQRKQDTRNKIMMGGLVIKAGLDKLHNQDKAALLGLLIDAKEKLDSGDGKYLKQIKELGDREFNNKNLDHKIVEENYGYKR